MSAVKPPKTIQEMMEATDWTALEKQLKEYKTVKVRYDNLAQRYSQLVETNRKEEERKLKSLEVERSQFEQWRDTETARFTVETNRLTNDRKICEARIRDMDSINTKYNEMIELGKKVEKERLLVNSERSKVASAEQTATEKHRQAWDAMRIADNRKRDLDKLESDLDKQRAELIKLQSSVEMQHKELKDMMDAADEAGKKIATYQATKEYADRMMTDANKRLDIVRAEEHKSAARNANLEKIAESLNKRSETLKDREAKVEARERQLTEEKMVKNVLKEADAS